MASVAMQWWAALVIALAWAQGCAGFGISSAASPRQQHAAGRHASSAASMVASVFIDGEAGTTGLQVRGRLEKRADIELITLPESERKDAKARARAINEADAVILCLPDAAAIEAQESVGTYVLLGSPRST